MASYVISSGATSAYTLKPGDKLVVSSGGESDGSIVSSGATESVLSAGVSFDDTLLSGGTLILSPGAIAESVTVSSGGVVSAGLATLDGTNTVAGRLISGSLGNFNADSDPNLYGALEILSGGVAQDLSIAYGGAEVQSGGSALGATLVGNFGNTYATLAVDSGGKATDTTVGVNQLVYDYGVISDTVLSGGQTVVYGSAVSTTVDAGGNEIVGGGGVAIDASVALGGSQTVEAGGLASRTKVESSGTFVLSAGGVATSVVVESGGFADLVVTVSKGQTLSEGGVASALHAAEVVSGVTVESGAYLSVLDPVIDSGGVLVQAAGAGLSGLTVLAGGKLSGGDIVFGGEYTYDVNTDAGLVVGVALSATYSELGELQVLSGGEAETVSVGFNDELDVQSGGVGSAVVVSGADSLLEVEAGGYVHGATIGGTPTATGQSANVFGSSADVVVKAGGFEVVESGGSATRTTVSSGGQQLVLSGGDAIDTVVKAGGEILLSQGGSATGGTVSSGGVAIVSIDVASGQTFKLPASVVTEAESLDGLTVSSGGVLQITDATVESGGRLDLESHVLGDGVTVSFGGLVEGPGTLLGAAADLGTVEKITVGDAANDAARLDVGSGGLAEEVTVLNAGVAVRSGGAGETLTISSGGAVTVESGGRVVGAQAHAGGALGLVFGAAVSSATVSSGATLTLSQGAIAAGATATGGVVTVSTASGGATALSGAIVDRADTIVSSGAKLDLGLGGQGDSLSISSGGTVSGAGRLVGATFNAGAVSGVVLAGFMEDTGRVHGATLSSGAVLQIQGLAESDVVSSGASVVVQSGGVASRMTLSSGGAQTILAGGVSDATTVSRGAAQIVSSGGVDSGTVVKAGGSETLSYGAVASAVTISSGGTAVLEDAIVSSGATIVLRATGSAASIDGVSGLAGATLHIAETFVNSGGTLSLAAGASYDNVHVLAGGTLLGPGDIGDDDVTPQGQVDSSYHQFVDAGLISGVTVGMSGLADLTILAGGVIDNVRDYASIQVSSGGRASGITLESASAGLGVDGGGVASRIVVDQGEVQVVGSATGIVASSGSLVIVDGQATSVSLASNAELWVGAGGVVSAALVAAGGALLLDLNGTVVGGTVAAGGALILDHGGETVQSGHTLSVGALAATTTVDGVVVSKGGFVNVADLDVASGATVSFGSGGALGTVDIQSGAVVKGAGVIYGQSEIYGAVSGITAETNPDYTPNPVLLESYPLQQYPPPTQAIESGGSVTALTVGSGGNAYVAVGGAVTRYVVEASGSLSVDGAATSGQVQSGGFLLLGSGTLTSATVQSGGTFRDTATVTVSSGRKAVDGTQTALTSIGGVRLSAGAIAEYGLATVLSGGVMSLNASVLNPLDYDDTLTVSAGGVASGAGLYDGAITDYGLVSGVKLGNTAVYPYGILEAGLTVASGGSASAVTILFDSALVVESGGRVVDAVIDGGASGSDAYGRETVDSGGVASGGAVLSNGSAIFASGATAKGVVVSSGGYVTLGFGVASGQQLSVATSAPSVTTVLDGVTIDAGAYLLLSGVVVSSGGKLLLGSNAVAQDLTISAGGGVSGGVLNAFNGDVALDDGLLEDARFVGALTVGSGGVGRDLAIADSSLTIDSGGVVSGVEVQPGLGSNIQVNAGGVLDDAVLDAAPGESINVYGSASDDAIGSGGVEAVQSGGVDTGAVIRNGGELVGNGGVVSGATVLSGGEYVNGAAEAEAVVISSGGRDLVNGYAYVAAGQTLVDGAVATTTLIDGASLLKGAIADYGAQIETGGVFSVGVGGEAQTVYVDQGGVVSGAGALISGGQNAGKIEGVTLYGELADAGVTSVVHIASGALDNMSAGATARGDSVQSGGEQIVSAGATATLEQVLSGGQIIVSAGGVASDVTVSSGGSATFQTVVSSGVTQTFALPGAAASSTFGSLKLDSGATAILQDAVVLSGGKLVLDAGVAVAGGLYYVVNGYTEYSASAGVTVSSGGALSGAGGVAGLLTVLSGGVASGVSVLSGGTDLVESGARQSAVKVDSGAGMEALGLKITGAVVAGTVSAAETLAGATVSSGAQVTISGAAVADGGSLQVMNGGYVEDATTVAGGVLIDGGTVTFDQSGSVKLAGSLSGGGVLQLTGSGTTLVLSGAGSHFTGQAVIEGAAVYNNETEAYSAVSDVLEIATASGLGTGAVEFEGFPTVNTSATLQIDAADTPAAGATLANALNNFTSSTDFVDLRGLAYVAGASAKISGSTLTLTDGGRTEKFTLTGETVATFTVASDGHGGTLIAPTAPESPALDARVVAFTHAAAAFAPSDAARTALVSSTAPAAETPFLNAGAAARAERL